MMQAAMQFCLAPVGTGVWAPEARPRRIILNFVLTVESSSAALSDLIGPLGVRCRVAPRRVVKVLAALLRHLSLQLRGTGPSSAASQLHVQLNSELPNLFFADRREQDGAVHRRGPHHRASASTSWLANGTLTCSRGCRRYSKAY